MPPSSSLLYTKRYEEGYDLTHDKRYNCWVQVKNDEGTMKGCVSSEPVTINDPALPKSTIVSKDVSKESGIDASEKNNASVARKEPAQLKHSIALSKVLSSQELAVVKIATKPPKTSACVLTSSENMKILEEKE